MDRKKEIIKILDSISGRYSAYEVFSDWIRCSALAISNSCQFFHDRIWQDREQEYINTVKKYKPEEQQKIVEMLCLLIETLEHGTEDVLGQIYMDSGMGSRASGQFFTPWHLSVLSAEVSVPEPGPDGFYRVYEPSCGAGAWRSEPAWRIYFFYDPCRIGLAGQRTWYSYL